MRKTEEFLSSVVYSNLRKYQPTIALLRVLLKDYPFTPAPFPSFSLNLISLHLVEVAPF